MKLSAIARCLRDGPFDLSTQVGRAEERYRLAALSILASVLGRGLSVAAMVLGVSLTVPYLGVERFGVWMTIASFSNMLAFLDLGTGNALTNHVATCAAKKDAEGVRQAISGGLGFLAVIGAAVAMVLVALAAALPWDRLLRSSEPLLIDEARRAAILFGVLFGVSIFTSGIQKVFAGLQRAFEAHAASAAGSILSIVGLWVCTSRHAGVPVLLLVTLGSQLLSTTFLLRVLARRHLVSWREVKGNTRGEARKLIRISTLFLILQLGTMVGWGADSLFISSILGVAQVAVYSVTQRLMQFVTIPLGMVNLPLWAAYADANARGDAGFIRKTLKRSFVGTLIAAVMGVGLLALVAQPVITYWTHGKVQVDQAFVWVFGAWAVLEAAGNSFAMFLNGRGLIRQQVASVLIFCMLVTPLKFLLGANYGINGVVIATIVSYLVAFPLLYLTLFRATFSRALRSPVT